MLSCFDLEPPRNRSSSRQGLFPSVRYVQQAWARFGAEVVVCPDAEAVIDAIDERTLLVPISHVLYKTAEIQPVERIVERAHAAGRARLSRRVPVGGHRAARRDGARDRVLRRRVGEVAVRRAGRGLAVRAARPRRAARAGVRRLAGARAAVRVRDGDGARAGRARFLTGTPNVAANYAASAGYEIVAEIGVDRIRANSMRQTALLVELVDAAGLRAHVTARPCEARRVGRLPRAGLPGRACGARRARDHLRHRPDAGIRFGPHFFTTDDELRFAVDAGAGDPRVGRAPRARARGGRLLEDRDPEHEQHERRCRRTRRRVQATGPRVALGRHRSRGCSPRRPACTLVSMNALDVRAAADAGQSEQHAAEQRCRGCARPRAKSPPLTSAEDSRDPSGDRDGRRRSARSAGASSRTTHTLSTIGRCADARRSPARSARPRGGRRRTPGRGSSPRRAQVVVGVRRLAQAQVAERLGVGIVHADDAVDAVPRLVAEVPREPDVLRRPSRATNESVPSSRGPS